MKYNLENETCYLFFEGELNSYNADNIDSDIKLTLQNLNFKTLILDFSRLNYISSAGLRVILRLKQKYSDVHVIEASLEVYDVLQMTGFTNIMDVKKALNRVYIAGAEVIGEGYTATVYRIDKDTIIKVFNRTNDIKDIERELNLAKEAFILGIPTAISFDVVRVDDKLGVRFEMLDCSSLRNVFLDNSDQYQNLLEKYVQLLKKINTTECLNENVPDVKAMYIDKVEAIKDLLEEKYYLKLKELISLIPERNTFVHGDCHFKNIMVQGDELLLIDMDTLSKGHPIFELAALRAPYVAFEEDDPGNSERFLGVSTKFANKLYDDIINLYFDKNREVIKDKIALVCYLHMVWWNRVNDHDNPMRLNGCRNRLYKLLDKYDDLDIEI